jgi:tetratricopeptide (TPR) repeat protein
VRTSTMLEMFMRFAAPAIALSALLLTVSSVSYGKRQRDDVIDPRSVAMTATAMQDVNAGQLERAIDGLETSLLIDPRNRAAYVGLAIVARKQDLPGKAIRLYREALLIDPNDLGALSGQGEAMVQKGALTKAKENLARIERLCGATCAERQKLAAAITKGAPAPKPMMVEAVTPKPMVDTAPSTSPTPVPAPIPK